MTQQSQVTKKPKAYRSSVLDIRQSMEIANDLMRGGAAFVCDPYFSPEQKAIAAALAAQNLNSVCFEGAESE